MYLPSPVFLVSSILEGQPTKPFFHVTPRWSHCTEDNLFRLSMFAREMCYCARTDLLGLASCTSVNGEIARSRARALAPVDA